ncbi:GNAT family N-acetyltransferase [Plantibacter sp. YIM 135347]|uniref:GNAT family N-acetyltransferase n=1 Tax=Plantibacter sp. YIM 135347 TaxID=3423919 RepID=UPI003D34AE28
MSTGSDTISYHEAPARDIDPVTLYRILRLRVDTFVIEQTALFSDLDGRDIEDETLLAWAEEAGEVVATLRVLTDPDVIVIGRVATAPSARGRGFGGSLMQRAVDANRDRPIRIEAQERLSGWYAGFGFEPCGPTYVEDDILHVPMLRPAG